MSNDTIDHPYVRTPTMMRTPRRLVQKSLDGDAQIKAFLLQQTTGIGYSKMVETAVFLLNSGVCPSDVNKMMGMPLTAARKLGGETWSGVRMGRVPGNIGRVFLNPLGHLRVSVFLSFLERVTRVTGAEAINGDAFAAALKALRDTCGSAGEEYANPRYLVLAVMEVTGGTCWLHTCSTCRVRFLRSRVLQRVQSGVYSHGACPLCRHVSSVRGSTFVDLALAPVTTGGVLSTHEPSSPIAPAFGVTA